MEVALNGCFGISLRELTIKQGLFVIITLNEVGLKLIYGALHIIPD